MTNDEIKAHNAEQAAKLEAMKIGDCVDLLDCVATPSRYYLTRVPGGWVFDSTDGRCTLSSVCFIPLPSPDRI